MTTVSYYAKTMRNQFGFVQCAREIEELMKNTREADWDGSGAAALDPETFQGARKFLEVIRLMNDDTKADLTPYPDEVRVGANGKLGLFWYERNFEKSPVMEYCAVSFKGKSFWFSYFRKEDEKIETSPENDTSDLPTITNFAKCIQEAVWGKR
jgi:hypothetical protein